LLVSNRGRPVIMERVGAIQRGEEKATVRPKSSLSVSKGDDYKKEGDRIFGRVCCDRVRGNDFKLELVRLRLDNKEEVFYGKSSEALE